MKVGDIVTTDSWGPAVIAALVEGDPEMPIIGVDTGTEIEIRIVQPKHILDKPPSTRLLAFKQLVSKQPPAGMNKL